MTKSNIRMILLQNKTKKCKDMETLYILSLVTRPPFIPPEIDPFRPDRDMIIPINTLRNRG